jgi:hypothetical protein
MRLHTTIREVRSNLTLTVFERGKRVKRSRGHNIFLTLGRIWLPDAVSYSSLPAGSPPPPTPVTKTDSRGVRYMGLGIGGTRQDKPLVVNAAPYSTHYPGTSLQTDTDPEVLRLERPVRISSPIPAAPVLPPYDAADLWLGQIIAPAVKPTTTSVRFSRLFTETEISYGPFLSVPVSEIALFLHSDDVNYVYTYNNTAVSYDTFDSLSITTAFSLLVEWDWRFLWATYIVSRTPPGSGRWASRWVLPRSSPTATPTTSSTGTTAGTRVRVRPMLTARPQGAPTSTATT